MLIKKKIAALFGATALVLAACSSTENATTPTAGGETATPAADALKVETSFYPLQYVVSQVGGEHVDVSSLTPSGSDAHNLELSPRQVTQLSEADLVVYLSGFQAAMDDAVSVSNLTNVIDAADYVDLNGEHVHNHDHSHDDHDHSEDAHDHSEDAHDDHDHSADGHDHGDDHDHSHDNHDHSDDAQDLSDDAHDHSEDAHDDHDHAADDHSGDGHDHADDGHGHDHSGPDPHFWLDPTRMAELADPVADKLSELDPHNAETYKANADKLAKSLEALDADYHARLEKCESKIFVTTHAAFGYIARAYNLDQQSIAGIETDTEPSPARVAEVTDMIHHLGVSTIFATSEPERKIADTFGAEAGVKVELLDALATQINPNEDYDKVMRSNLDLLTSALKCQ